MCLAGVQLVQVCIREEVGPPKAFWGPHHPHSSCPSKVVAPDPSPPLQSEQTKVCVQGLVEEAQVPVS